MTSYRAAVIGSSTLTNNTTKPTDLTSNPIRLTLNSVSSSGSNENGICQTVEISFQHNSQRLFGQITNRSETAFPGCLITDSPENTICSVIANDKWTTTCSCTICSGGGVDESMRKLSGQAYILYLLCIYTILFVILNYDLFE